MLKRLGRISQQFHEINVCVLYNNQYILSTLEILYLKGVESLKNMKLLGGGYPQVFRWLMIMCNHTTKLLSQLIILMEPSKLVILKC